MKSNSLDLEKTETDFNPFEGTEISKVALSTEPQREIWAAVQMGCEASCAYNESVTLFFKGIVNLELLKKSLESLSLRHESLRTTFSKDGLSLLVSPSVSFSFQVDQNKSIEEIKLEEVTNAFDLEKGPLFRTRILATNVNETYFVFTAHHIVCDGYSLAILIKDLAQIYTGSVKNESVSLPTAIEFSSYSGEQQKYAESTEGKICESYWVKKYEGEVPVLEIPTDRNRPALKTYGSERIDYEVSSTLVTSLKKVGTKNGSSFFATLLSAFNAYLFRISAQQKIVVGIPAAGQQIGENDQLVGHCVNLLPVLSELNSKMTFSSFLKKSRGVILDAYDHQQMTFGNLIKKLPISRDASRLPLVSVLFNLDQAIDGSKLSFAGLKTEFHSNPRKFENFEIFINAAETAGKLILECQYNTDLFDASTIQRRLAEFETLLESISENADALIGHLAIVPKNELEKILIETNQTQMNYPRDFGVHQLFEKQAELYSEKIAAEFENDSITYKELNERSNQLAHYLRENGIKRGELVGLETVRSLEMLIGMLGVLKSGAGYVPIDPAYPKDRTDFMIQNSNVRTLINESVIKTETQSYPKTTLPPSEYSSQPESIAYVIYTSGSTGMPKGVQVPHRAVVNFLTSMAEKPGLKNTDKLLAVTTLSFDIAVLELYLPITVGATTVIASRETTLDGEKLEQTIENKHITAMQATPSTWRLLLASEWTGKKGFKILCGGEALPKDLLNELIGRCGGVWNMYGPTETTVWSTCNYLNEKNQKITIGKPIGNTQVYILDSELQICPVGTPGELHIGGAGVTLGYLNREDLTLERFIPNPYFDPFSEDLYSHLYKTGDLAQLLPDGNVEYLRRNDTQVKVRGYRIELEEIETVLSKVPGVLQAIVKICELSAEDLRIVGYFKAKDSTDITDEKLRDSLREKLPEYMIPQHFLKMDSFPLTQNGKIDRKLLPLPSELANQNRNDLLVEARNETEQKLSAVWKKVLNLNSVGVLDNFFQIGGHSLLATQVVARMRKEFKQEFSLKHIFEAPTIESLAKLVDKTQGVSSSVAHDLIGKRSDLSQAPLSLMQQRLWYIESLTPSTPIYNLPAAFRMKGRLNALALEESINLIIERHDSLRTNIVDTENGPLQVIRPDLKLALLPATNSNEKDAVDEMHTFAETAFNISADALVKVKLYCVSKEEHILFFMPHHAVWDGWSFDNFLAELKVAYDAKVKQTTPQLPLLPVQYGDYSIWHRNRIDGENLNREKKYWVERLSGSLPVLELPTDYPRPAVMNFKGGFEPFFIEKDLIDQLNKVAQKNSVTLFMVLLSTFKLLLMRYTHQEDVIVGSPIQGRTHSEIENLIGFFVNTLVLRTSLEKNYSFSELLSAVRQTCLEAFAHQDMPFETLVEELKPARDMSRTAIYQSFFTFQDVRNRSDEMDGIALDQITVHGSVTPTDVSLWVKETGKGMVGGLDYAADLFKPETMKQFISHFKNLLATIAVNDSFKIKEVSFLSVEEKQEQLIEWNQTSQLYSQNSMIFDLIDTQADQTPNAVAVICGDSSFTYAELKNRTDALAAALLKKGIKAGDRVGICIDRKFEMLVGMLGILKAGACYVPLDPAFPIDRLAYMIEDSEMSLIVTQKVLVSDLPETRTDLFFIEDVMKEDLSYFRKSERLKLLPAQAAYLIYTSGSTGKPKGVLVPHSAVVNFLTSMQKKPGITSKDVLVAVTTLSFDIAVLELYLPLICGGKVVIATRETASDGNRLKSLIEKTEATFLQATPATWRLLCEAGFSATQNFKALCGGEALAQDLVRELLPRVSSIWNMYGPTETTVWSTCTEVKNAEDPIVIGKPIGNTTCYLLDQHLNPVPVGVTAELHIGGLGVSLGYFKKEELTKERFISNPFKKDSILYKTGDLCRYKSDGNIEYVSRNDNQVKVRGYRIELPEIESVLSKHESVKQAVVIVREDQKNDVRLVAYVTLNEGFDCNLPQLKKHCRKSLPEYMIPTQMLRLEAFPMTNNNKIDRKSLPKPEMNFENKNEKVLPRTESEKVLFETWKTVLGSENFGVTDNFFNIGGHSLLSMQVISKVEQRTKIRLNPKVMLLNTLEQIASEYLPVKEMSPTDGNDPTSTNESLTEEQPDQKKSLLGRWKKKFL